MKFVNYITVLVLSTFLIACGKEAPLNYQPSGYLKPTEIEAFKYSISRYACKLPRFATHENKFEMKFDEAYAGLASGMKLDKYYKGEQDTIYFEINQLAPSLKIKRTATGGKMVKNQAGEITFYEEIYRTWKMEDSLLKVRTPLFFEGMVHHKNLEKYYTDNINSDTYIEFPNKNVIFDVKSRKWISKSSLAYYR